MVTIISKSDRPRREDEAARKLLEANRPTINRLADHLTQGAWSARRAAPAEPPLIVPSSSRRAATSIDNPRPYVRVSPNGRVVVADLDSARQLAFLGEIRRRDGHDVFVLARAESGFAASLDEETVGQLAEFDGRVTDGRQGLQSLKDDIALKLGLA